MSYGDVIYFPCIKPYNLCLMQVKCMMYEVESIPISGLVLRYMQGPALMAAPPANLLPAATERSYAQPVSATSLALPCDGTAVLRAAVTKSVPLLFHPFRNSNRPLIWML